MYYLTLGLNALVLLLGANKIDYSALIKSFLGCAFFLQGWFPSLINVGGVLWQIAVFIFGYALFPFVSPRIATWSISHLVYGILLLWLMSAGLILLVLVLPPDTRLGEWWIWHVHCIARLPHFLAGVLLGQVVEKLREQQQQRQPDDMALPAWALVVTCTDLISVILVTTAVQAPFIQMFFGTSVRMSVSIALEAILLPLHALWLAGMVLAHYSSSDGDTITLTSCCWTRRVLSFQPLTVLGNISLAIYCLHIVVLFLYTMILSYLSTGNWHIFPSIDNYEMQVQAEWWQAPIQWVLVLAVSMAATRWYEAPLRERLGRVKRVVKPARGALSDDAKVDGEAVGLLPGEQHTQADGIYGAVT